MKSHDFFYEFLKRKRLPPIAKLFRLPLLPFSLAPPHFLRDPRRISAFSFSLHVRGRKPSSTHRGPAFLGRFVLGEAEHVPASVFWVDFVVAAPIAALRGIVVLAYRVRKNVLTGMPGYLKVKKCKT